MSQLQLVEYNPDYAEALAVMWNNSSWRGEKITETAESVRKKESSSKYLNLYLALKDELVVGYCKYGMYELEPDTAFIMNLIVRADSHNQKIGKALVQKCVERSIELAIPRVDLFTWAGNEKAIPLYKKCGFFWEKGHDSHIHFVNFIPSLVNSNLLGDYFKFFDWYLDSCREINIEIDGIAKNGFSHYHYEWRKDNKYLSVEFEKNGKGISRIETDEYIVETIVISKSFVFGQDYAIEYHITNKHSTPLMLKIEGLIDKNINCSTKFDGEIVDNLTIEGNFYVGKIDCQQNIDKTYPSVVNEVTINGKSIFFKTGILTVEPLAISIRNLEPLVFSDKAYTIDVDFQNNFNESCLFEMELPSVPEVEFLDKKISIQLQSKEIKSVQIKFIPQNSVIVYHDILINAKFKTKATLQFNQKLDFKINTYDGRGYGETKSAYCLSYGKLNLINEKETQENLITIKNLISNLSVGMKKPQFCTPFLPEFDTKEPYLKKFFETQNSVTLSCFFRSEELVGCEFSRNVKISSGGIISVWLDILSFPHNVDEFSLSLEIGIDIPSLTLPYNHKIIKLERAYKESSIIFDSMDSEKVFENWVYVENANGSLAFIWPNEYQFKFGRYRFNLTHKFSKSSKMSSKPLILAMDTFVDAQAVRKFALPELLTEMAIADKYSVELNNNNPFIRDCIRGALVANIEKQIDCTMSAKLISDSQILSQVTQNQQSTDNMCRFELLKTDDVRLGLIKFNAQIDNAIIEETRALFFKRDEKVLLTNYLEGEYEVYAVDNGLMNFKIAPEFALSLYSLVCGEVEWLDSEFPNRVSKSFWKDWTGGLTHYPIVSKERMSKSKRATNFISIKDNFSNEWQGVEISSEVFGENQVVVYIVKQYYLTLPGLPIMASFVKVCKVQSEDILNSHTIPVEFSATYFINNGNNPHDISYSLKYDKNRLNIRRGNNFSRTDINAKLIKIMNNKNKEKFYFYNSQVTSSGSVYHNISVVMGVFYDKALLDSFEPKFSKPKFVILSSDDLEERSLIDLDNIVFLVD